MVYVFGIEGVPVFEALFITSVLLLIGQVLNLLEMRKLTSLIRQEKEDLSRFENDLARFEGSKPNDDLVEHIRQAMKSGLSRAQITDKLYSKGFSMKQADDLLKKASKDLNNAEGSIQV